jgi:signal recognition particle receptor subunit beta
VEFNFPHQPTMSSQAGWDSVTGIATKLLDGSPLAIAIAILITFGVPVLLHVIFYRAAASPPSSNFLLLGPSGAGKTAFATLVGFHSYYDGVLRF